MILFTYFYLRLGPSIFPGNVIKQGNKMEEIEETMTIIQIEKHENQTMKIVIMKMATLLKIMKEIIKGKNIHFINTTLGSHIPSNRWKTPRTYHPR